MTKRTLISTAVLASALAVCQLSNARVNRRPAPDFTVRDEKGGLHELQDFRGKVVLLNFWATWCGACNEEIPSLEKMHERFASRGLEVVSVALDKGGWQELRPFVQTHTIGYPVFVPEGGTRDAYADVTAVPTMILIDRAGRIAFRHVGIDAGKGYVREIGKILGEASPWRPAAQRLQRVPVSR